MGLLCFFKDWRLLNRKIGAIIAKLEDITNRQDATLEAVKAVDAAVESLFDEIKKLQNQGEISDSVAAVLLAKQDEIDAAIAKVATDEPVAEPETPPSE